MLDQPRFLFANALPGLLLAGVLLVLSRRALLSFGLAFLAAGTVYGVNGLKVANLGTPLLPDDFRMVGQLQQRRHALLAGYLPHSPWPYLALLAGVAGDRGAVALRAAAVRRAARGGTRLLAGSVMARPCSACWRA